MNWITAIENFLYPYGAFTVAVSLFLGWLFAELFPIKKDRVE